VLLLTVDLQGDEEAITVPVHLEQILSEYRQFPGLRLTSRQAARLWMLEPILCERLLNELVNEGYLYVDASGQYAFSGRVGYGGWTSENAREAVA
jgi:hypothetical protein